MLVPYPLYANISGFCSRRDEGACVLQMLCDVTSAVTELMVREVAFRSQYGCVTSPVRVAEFMVRMPLL
jgi:hypothetical protein